jgi:hypothetical protein
MSLRRFRRGQRQLSRLLRLDLRLLDESVRHAVVELVVQPGALHEQAADIEKELRGDIVEVLSEGIRNR